MQEVEGIRDRLASLAASFWISIAQAVLWARANSLCVCVRVRVCR